MEATLTMDKPSLEVIQKTSKIRKLITSLPVICECMNAERLAVMFGAAYDTALTNGTALDCMSDDIENPGKRMMIINPGNYSPGNTGKAWIGYARLVIAEFATYLHKGRISKEQMDSVISRFSIQASQPDPEIDAILTYEQAVTMSWWWL